MPLTKGHSGNLTGKSAAKISLSSRYSMMLAERTDDGRKLVNFLMSIFDDKTSSLDDRKWAYERICERMMGKPNQSIELTGTVEVAPARPNLATLTLEELEALEAITAKTITLPDKPKALTQ